MKTFNQKINEMLVLLNAVKKSKKKDDGVPKIDSVTDIMNNALGDFGVNVSNPSDDSDDDDEDSIEGSLDKVSDLDLPRPDTEDGEDGEDESDAFDFMNVGNPTDVNMNQGDDETPDEVGDKIKFEYVGGKGLVVSIGDKSATLSGDHIRTVKDFIDSLDLSDDSDADDGETDNGETGDDSDDENGSDDDGVTESFYDPNGRMNCPDCGRPMDYDPHSMLYRCMNCHKVIRGKSYLRDTTTFPRGSAFGGNRFDEHGRVDKKYSLW